MRSEDSEAEQTSASVDALPDSPREPPSRPIRPLPHRPVQPPHKPTFSLSTLAGLSSPAFGATSSYCALSQNTFVDQELGSAVDASEASGSNIRQNFHDPFSDDDDDDDTFAVTSEAGSSDYKGKGAQPERNTSQSQDAVIAACSHVSAHSPELSVGPQSSGYEPAGSREERAERQAPAPNVLVPLRPDLETLNDLIESELSDPEATMEQDEEVNPTAYSIPDDFSVPLQGRHETAVEHATKFGMTSSSAHSSFAVQPKPSVQP